MLRAIGIDLGSTYSVIAALRAGEPEPLTGRAGSPLIPSVLTVAPSGRLQAGHAALALAEGTAPIVHPFGPAAESAGASLNGQSYTHTELIALLLVALREDAEAVLGEPVRRAVLTVPASFNGGQVAALRSAAAMAGLLPLRIIPSPVAAALAYALSQPQALTQTIFCASLVEPRRWLMKSVVWPRLMRSNSSYRRLSLMGSSAAVGSSSMRSLAGLAMARAMAMRCHSPPERSCPPSRILPNHVSTP